MKFMMIGLLLILSAPAAFSRIRPQINRQQNNAAAAKTDIIFPIRGKVILEGRVIQGSIHQSEIDSLLFRRVDLAGNPNEYGKYGLGFIYEEGKLPAFSCQEWAQSRVLDLDSNFNTYERTMDGFFVDTCSFLYALKGAKPARRSFITNQGLSSLNLLPINLLNTLTGDPVSGVDDEGAKKMTINQLVAKRQARVVRKTADALQMKYEYEPDEKGFGYEMYFNERGRADFDGDGIEDIFISTSWYVINGTFRVYDYCLLTRRSPTVPFEVKELELSAIKENPQASFPGLALKSNQLKRLKLSKQTYGKDWPFAQEEGEVACAQVGSVAVFWIAGGKSYPLNVWARGSTIDSVAVASDTDTIENGGSLSPIFDRPFAMCRLEESQSPRELQKSCRNFVQGFYNWYVRKLTKERPKGEAYDLKPEAFDRELRRQLKAYDAANREGIGLLDFDPIVTGQDFSRAGYQAGKVTRKNDRFLVEVYCLGGCLGGGKSDLVVLPELIYKDGQWRFMNFHYNFPDGSKGDLLSILKADRNNDPKAYQKRKPSK
jgi:hypothetical protein